MGTDFIRCPMATRLLAAMKYPAWVCWSWEKYLVTALPRILTANRPSACHAVAGPVFPSSRARMV